MRLIQFLLIACTLGCVSRGKSQTIPSTGKVAVESESTAELDASHRVLDVSSGPSKGDDIKAVRNSPKINSDPVLMQVIGLPASSAELLAEQNGKRFRVVQVDGVRQTVTADLAPDRISAEIEKGVVVSAKYY